MCILFARRFVEYLGYEISLALFLVRVLLPFK